MRLPPFRQSNNTVTWHRDVDQFVWEPTGPEIASRPSHLWRPTNPVGIARYANNAYGNTRTGVLSFDEHATRRSVYQKLRFCSDWMSKRRASNLDLEP